ncbi:polynucleotide kinase 3 phosphatase, partial [Limtongia smithiae]|uniref:polynucleotide kinase 3 phosphatase n=1 Tax=Limtongia smithiae TaxID=1125753 RepID=UPI0034CDD370
VVVSAFDLDGTLIDTKSHSPFPKDENDWEYLRPREHMIRRIQASMTLPSTSKLRQRDYDNDPNVEHVFAIFSNQNGIQLTTKKSIKTKTEPVRLQQWKTKLENITADLNIPCYIFASIEKDMYRKPDVGMWSLLEKVMKEDSRYEGKELEFVKEASIFVGDAAGRHGDHSDCDLEFAKNLAIKFHVPEDFLG